MSNDLQYACFFAVWLAVVVAGVWLGGPLYRWASRKNDKK